MGISLGQAARLAGRGKTTLTRAIQAGRLSATRRADGGYEIDPAELARVYSIKVEMAVTPETGRATVEMVHHEIPDTRLRDTERDPETVARLAALEAELRGLRELLGEVRQSRDDWRAQAERLALGPPATTGTSSTPSSRPWWRRIAG